MGTRPAHVLADVLDTRTFDGSTQHFVQFRTPLGDDWAWIPSQYVIVGDELEDLYPELEETEE